MAQPSTSYSQREWAKRLAQAGPLSRSPSTTSTRSEANSKGKKNFYAKTFKIMSNAIRDGDEEVDAGDLMYLPSTSRSGREKAVKSDASLSSAQSYQEYGTRKDAGPRKAQFRTEKSLLTFHGRAEADDGEDRARRKPSENDIREIYNEIYRLVLSKLDHIIRLLERKDAT